MSPTISLIVFALMTLGSLFYIFYLPGELSVEPTKSRLAFLRERKEVVYENLRDLNFEFKAGKFPEADYESMRKPLEEEAAAVLAEISRLEQAALSATSIPNRKGVRA